MHPARTIRKFAGLTCFNHKFPAGKLRFKSFIIFEHKLPPVSVAALAINPEPYKNKVYDLMLK